MLEQTHSQIRRNNAQSSLKSNRSYLLVCLRQTRLRGLAGSIPGDHRPGELGLCRRVVGVEPQLDRYCSIP